MGKTRRKPVTIKQARRRRPSTKKLKKIKEAVLFNILNNTKSLISKINNKLNIKKTKKKYIGGGNTPIIDTKQITELQTDYTKSIKKLPDYNKSIKTILIELETLKKLISDRNKLTEQISNKTRTSINSYSKLNTDISLNKSSINNTLNKLKKMIKDMEFSDNEHQILKELKSLTLSK